MSIDLSLRPYDKVVNLTVDEMLDRYFDKPNNEDGRLEILKGMIKLYYESDFAPGWLTFGEIKEFYQNMSIDRWADLLDEIDPDEQTGWHLFRQFNKYISKAFEPVASNVKLYWDDPSIIGTVDQIYRHRVMNYYIACDWKRERDLKLKGEKIPYHNVPNCNGSRYKVASEFATYVLDRNYNVDSHYSLFVNLHPEEGLEIFEVNGDSDDVVDYMDGVTCMIVKNTDGLEPKDSDDLYNQLKSHLYETDITLEPVDFAIDLYDDERPYIDGMPIDFIWS